MNVTLLLCDAAEVSGGKLYVLGGGWSLLAAEQPVNTALAILLAVPWDQTNRKILFAARLMTDDGDPVELEGQPVAASGILEVGRPPGIKPGTDLNTPVALKFNAIVLPAGGYRWEVEVDGDLAATAAFRAIEGGLPG